MARTAAVRTQAARTGDGAALEARRGRMGHGVLGDREALGGREARKAAPAVAAPDTALPQAADRAEAHQAEAHQAGVRRAGVRRAGCSGRGGPVGRKGLVGRS
ncbi:hypothetical protein GCM10023085_63610 [Actinomadura viridis]